MEYVVKRGDSLPSVADYLRLPGGAVPDLTGATVKFIYRIADNSAPAVTQSATIVDLISALVMYQWGNGELITAGKYNCEWEVTFGNGRKLTFPNDPRTPYITLWVPQDLA